MSQQRLGIDSIAGNHGLELIIFWKCTVCDIPDTELALYVDQAPMKNMIDRFVEIFVPLDVDIIFDFIPAANLVKETHENILGIGTYL
ncbi:hypothetical protein [Niabella ginsengisoli]|uniref:Uncharacterized protein n=1 Tax=Niabella ginsengisoli TaxID=522298 RepID=A0ABS9SGU7_9BACT|nr:hypothetical protein [Niabella ginsengisoli]MCH5597550.1 hypothetical protein [Niabella ginsengisoli]